MPQRVNRQLSGSSAVVISRELAKTASITPPARDVSEESRGHLPWRRHRPRPHDLALRRAGSVVSCVVMRRLACLAALVISGLAGFSYAQVPAGEPPPGATHFAVFLRGSAVGTIDVAVDRAASGVVVSGISRLGSPLSITVQKAEIQYDTSWKPVSCSFDMVVRDQVIRMRTTFVGGKASSEVAQAGQTVTKADHVAPDAVVLSNAFLGTYEALAARLVTTPPGTELRAYVVPEAEIGIRVNAVGDERIQTPGAVVQARHFQLTLTATSGPVDADLWAEPSGRLVRFSIPIQSLDIARADIATVAARRETLTRPGDESITIPAFGFQLAATLSRPSAGTAAPGSGFPAVVLVGGSGPTDRDETVANIPIFAQIAGALADAGFLVVRYDKRGVGQSGGRYESATIEDYGEDAGAVVRYLARRKDVDRKRIALVGHSEGGWTAILAAARNADLVAALVLMATPGTTGAELNLEQQRHALDRMTLSDEEKVARIELQKQIIKAVISGTGWERVPAALRKQADTPWYRSYLLFDPARQLPKVDKPILILQGMLDRQVSMTQAERLAAIAASRKGRAGQAVEMKVFAGLNHLLIPAKTGEVEEYAVLPDKHVSKELLTTLSTWLKATLAGQGRKSGRDVDTQKRR